MKKFVYACMGTLLLFAVCGFSLRRPQARNNEVWQTRIGIRNHINKAPLDVVGLKVNNKNILAGEQFSAGRGWIVFLRLTGMHLRKKCALSEGTSQSIVNCGNDWSNWAPFQMKRCASDHGQRRRDSAKQPC